ncbi:DNA primase [Desulfoprunum benzoelyticum]|uniref:DNA primase n=1 Tax=Desulfoprunum benzoelyticum TaxID=1506996 RepID=A0A840V114_9BACT|nr:DNA primase [Desulfoprunum benzoelyticum]MBB5346891.1 DNA primase [Desulfoprunum benzoelyticum]MBM9529447.1 DNA primase [Desulfoprunum benzoelyticum]
MKFQESREDIAARIKDQADIVKIIGESVDLKKSGTRFLGLCPFHGEKTPSFTVHPGQQFFHCFGCGESGDVFTFMMKYHHLDFPAALKELAARYQIALPEKPRSAAEEKLARKRQAMFAVNDRCATIYSRYLLESPGAAVAREYLVRRGVSAAVRDRFRIGYAPAVDVAGWDFLARQLPAEERRIAEELGLLVKKDNGGSYDRFRDRVLFPIFDIRGRVVGFGGRILGDGQPKYMNSPESPVFNKSRALLGLFQQGESIRRLRQAIVVEGNFDLISLVEHGQGNVVAPLGTALTREQLRLLHRFAEEIVLLFDGDSAGQKAAMRAVPLLFAEQMAGRIAVLPVGHDPDTFVRQEGVDALRKIVEKAEPLPEFVLASLIRDHGLTLDGKMRIIQELKPIADAAPSPLQRSVVLAHFSEKLGLPAGQMESFWTARVATGEGRREQSSGPTTGGSDHERGTSLSGTQRHLVGFMVLHPRFFPKLAATGLRDFLAGTVGEVLFLQMQAILAEKSHIEPEELLSLLPEGAERGLVSDLLMKAAGRSGDPAFPTSPEEELEDLVGWLRIQILRKKSMELQKKILVSQQQGDLKLIQLLVVEKQDVDRQLQGVEG